MIKLVNEKDDNRINLQGVKCKYIIGVGQGMYGKSKCVVVFERGSDAWYWVTGVNTGSLKQFKEGETYDIIAVSNDSSRYINNVRVANKG